LHHTHDYGHSQIETVKSKGTIVPKLEENHLDIISELNVDIQVTHMLHDYNVGALVKEGKLTIVGSIFDIHNVYEKGHGKVHITNINGITDVKELLNHPLLAVLSSEEREETVRRLFPPLPSSELIHHPRQTHH